MRKRPEQQYPGHYGVSEDNLEMLFIDARFIGQGIGKLLLLHAIANLNITKLNVNEQNENYIHYSICNFDNRRYDYSTK